MCCHSSISNIRYWVRGHLCLIPTHYKSVTIPACFRDGCSVVLMYVWLSLLMVLPLCRKYAALPACVMFALLAKVCDTVCLRKRWYLFSCACCKHHCLHYIESLYRCRRAYLDYGPAGKHMQRPTYTLYKTIQFNLIKTAMTLQRMCNHFITLQVLLNHFYKHSRVLHKSPW